MIAHLVAATGLTVAATLVTVAPSGSADAARAACADSNGSVYWSHSSPMTCDVSPPQRLHLTATPDQAACHATGGHGWAPGSRICWDVDY